MDVLPHLLNLSWTSLSETEIAKKLVQTHLLPFPTNVSDWALIFLSLYLCQQSVFEDNSFYKKRQHLLRQLLWIQNSRTKIWKPQCYLSKWIFKFICLAKLVREGTNKRLLFLHFFSFYFIKWAKRRRVLTSFTNVQNSFLRTKENTWVYLLLINILYIFLFSSIN